MGRLQEQRQAGVAKILNTLRAIDDWNMSNPHEIKELVKEKLISEVMMFFDVSSRTAEDWYKDACSMNRLYHDNSGKIELTKWKDVRDGDKNTLQNA